MTRPADRRTVGELHAARIITGPEIARAVARHEADPTATVRFTSGHSLDLAAAVAGHPEAAEALADPDVPASSKWTMVAAAIRLARPNRP